jgi:N-acetylglutamate synthase-like GNAT family acetyltransferase
MAIKCRLLKTAPNFPSTSLEPVVWSTEISLFGTMGAKVPQVPMWLDLPTAKGNESSELSLRPILGPADWDVYQSLPIEREPGLLEEIQQLVKNFRAEWYLASNKNGDTVGSLGLIEFSCEFGPFGRVLFVEIAPRFQGRGYGNQLMDSIIAIAGLRGLKGLCLKTDSHRWVKDWYKKLGFHEIGLWSPGSPWN